MEKGVDQVVGLRQKDKGRSWSKSGSDALAMRTASHANGHGDQLWNAANKRKPDSNEIWTVTFHFAGLVPGEREGVGQ